MWAVVNAFGLAPAPRRPSRPSTSRGRTRGTRSPRRGGRRAETGAPRWAYTRKPRPSSAIEGGRTTGSQFRSPSFLPLVLGGSRVPLLPFPRAFQFCCAVQKRPEVYWRTCFSRPRARKGGEVGEGPHPPRPRARRGGERPHPPCPGARHGGASTGAGAPGDWRRRHLVALCRTYHPLSDTLRKVLFDTVWSERTSHKSVAAAGPLETIDDDTLHTPLILFNSPRDWSFYCRMPPSRTYHV